MGLAPAAFLSLRTTCPVSWLGAATIPAIVLTAAMLAAFVVLALFRELPLRLALRPLARLPFGSRTEAAAMNFVHRSRRCSGQAVVERSVAVGNSRLIASEANIGI